VILVSVDSTCPTPSWSGEALLIKLEINRGKINTTQKYSIKIEKSILINAIDK
jgi:hypothetical protein